MRRGRSIAIASSGRTETRRDDHVSRKRSRALGARPGSGTIKPRGEFECGRRVGLIGRNDRDSSRLTVREDRRPFCPAHPCQQIEQAGEARLGRLVRREDVEGHREQPTLGVGEPVLRATRRAPSVHERARRRDRGTDRWQGRRWRGRRDRARLRHTARMVRGRCVLATPPERQHRVAEGTAR